MIDRTAAMRLADAWWAHVCDIQLVPIPFERGREILAGLVTDLGFALGSQPFTVDPAVHAGATLVELGVTDPVALVRTAAALGELPELSARAGEQSRYQARFPIVMAAVGQGFTQAMQHGYGPFARQRVREQTESRFRAVFDNIAAAMFVCDPEGRMSEVNPAMCQLLGRGPEMLRGASAFEFVHPEERRDLARRIYHGLVLPGHGQLRLEFRVRRADGAYAWIAGSLAVAAADDGGRCLIGVGEDVTEQRRVRDQLYWQARHDALTKLPNRLYLREVLDAAIASTGPHGRIGMCFLDLDGFKAVNDHHGHGVGDRLLEAVAGRLHDAVADKVSLLARLGGDEFVALIAPPVVEDRVMAVSRALLAAVCHPIDIDGRVLRVSASIGALSTKIGALDADALLDCADAGLYRAKADTRERIALQYNPSQEFPALSR
ncbi:MAG: GGDEF domain-containing protein [Mycobacteriaceae bacterium]|nr:GGDEF domain-containing protein [Mycobacteriaceae bacterium]